MVRKTPELTRSAMSYHFHLTPPTYSLPAGWSSRTPSTIFSTFLAGYIPTEILLTSHLPAAKRRMSPLQQTLNSANKSSVKAALSIGGLKKPKAIQPMRGTLGQPLQLLAG